MFAHSSTNCWEYSQMNSAQNFLMTFRIFENAIHFPNKKLPLKLLLLWDFFTLKLREATTHSCILLSLMWSLSWNQGHWPNMARKLEMHVTQCCRYWTWTSEREAAALKMGPSCNFSLLHPSPQPALLLRIRVVAPMWPRSWRYMWASAAGPRPGLQTAALRTGLSCNFLSPTCPSAHN